MFETIYLTSVEKKEFLQEFVCSMAEALHAAEENTLVPEKILNETAIDLEKEEALEKVRLIIRQFPKIPELNQPEKEFASSVLTPEVKTEKQAVTSNENIDSLLDDKDIRIIECSDSKVRIKKNGLFEETGFSMDESELKKVIEKFSEKTRIPIQEGVFRAKLGNLTIDAVISGVIGTRLLIIKGQ